LLLAAVELGALSVARAGRRVSPSIERSFDRTASFGSAAGLSLCRRPPEKGKPVFSRHAQRVRVVLADDHVLFLQTLRMILESDGRIEVIGEATDGAEAVELTASLQPDAVVLDVEMPTMDGIEAARRIARKAPGVRVLMLSSSGDPEQIRRARAAGAADYVTKDRSAGDLVERVVGAASGRGPGIASLAWAVVVG
jgi:CheY-like chemotaxis protein